MRAGGWITAAAAMLLLLLTGVTMSGSAAACGTGSGNVSVAAAAAHKPVVGYSGDQLANAAHVMNVAAALQLPARAQQIALMTAIGESSLRNLDYGDEGQGVTNPDGTATCSVGLFQQQWCLAGSPWGTRAQTMDPTHAATSFFTRLKAVPGWESMDPSVAAHSVQGNADPDHYTKYRPAAQAIVQALSGAATCAMSAVSGDGKALAQNLVAAIDRGQLRILEQRYEQQIRAVAAGTAAPNCGISVQVLQIITIAAQKFEKVGVSDLNRQCTGSLLGAGTGSSHWVHGGGDAVDFYSLNGRALTGGDGLSVQLITALDPVVPRGSRVGQIECRPATLPLRHFTEFEDSCDHLHIDIAYTNGAPLTLPAN